MITFGVPGIDGGPALPRLHGRVRHEGDRIEVRTAAATTDLHTLTEWALTHDTELRGLQLARPSLEQVYLDVVGRAERERADV